MNENEKVSDTQTYTNLNSKQAQESRVKTMPNGKYIGTTCNTSSERPRNKTTTADFIISFTKLYYFMMCFLAFIVLILLWFYMHLFLCIVQ